MDWDDLMTLSFCCVCGCSSVPWKLCTNIGGRFSTGLLPVFCVCRKKTRWNHVYHKYCWKSGKLNVEHHKFRVPLNFGAKTKTKLHSCSNGWSSIMPIWSLFRTRKATATYLTPLCWYILSTLCIVYPWPSQKIPLFPRISSTCGPIP